MGRSTRDNRSEAIVIDGFEGLGTEATSSLRRRRVKGRC